MLKSAEFNRFSLHLLNSVIRHAVLRALTAMSILPQALVVLEADLDKCDDCVDVRNKFSCGRCSSIRGSAQRK
eukprot:Skav200707  [mRNA]  locus=scaffold2650:60833:61812:- [translate_table: standard]